MENTATIDLNGIRYDAASGALLGAASAPPLTRGRNIDGFFRSRTIASPRSMPPPAEDTAVTSSKQIGPRAFHDVFAAPPVSHKQIATVEEQEQAPEPPRDSAQRNINHTRAHTPLNAKVRTVQIHQHTTISHSVEVRRGEANHVRHRRPQHSRTLRRDAVPTPAPSTYNALKPQGALQHSTPGLIEFKKAVASIDEGRLVRAQGVPKSPLVAHHDAASQPLRPLFAPLAVQPLPTSPPAEPTPAPGTGGAPEPPSPQPTNKPTDIFEHALANASHYVDAKVHAGAYRQKVGLHIAGMAAGTLALVIAAGFVVWQNSPALQLKTASIHSGVPTNMPNLAGTGLSYSNVRAGDGKITMGLAGSAGSSFQVTATNSNLSSADLIANVGSTDASGMPQYSVLHAGNTSVYRLSNTDATWIANGKWYTLSSSQAISDAQVKTIVAHL